MLIQPSDICCTCHTHQRRVELPRAEFSAGRLDVRLAKWHVVVGHVEARVLVARRRKVVGPLCLVNPELEAPVRALTRYAALEHVTEARAGVVGALRAANTGRSAREIPLPPQGAQRGRQAGGQKQEAARRQPE